MATSVRHAYRRELEDLVRAVLTADDTTLMERACFALGIILTDSPDSTHELE